MESIFIVVLKVCDHIHFIRYIPSYIPKCRLRIHILSSSSSSYATTSGFESDMIGVTDWVCALASTNTRLVSVSLYGPSNHETCKCSSGQERVFENCDNAPYHEHWSHVSWNIRTPMIYVFTIRINTSEHNWAVMTVLVSEILQFYCLIWWTVAHLQLAIRQGYAVFGNPFREFGETSHLMVHLCLFSLILILFSQLCVLRYFSQIMGL